MIEESTNNKISNSKEKHHIIIFFKKTLMKLLSTHHQLSLLILAATTAGVVSGFSVGYNHPKPQQHEQRSFHRTTTRTRMVEGGSGRKLDSLRLGAEFEQHPEPRGLPSSLSRRELASALVSFLWVTTTTTAGSSVSNAATAGSAGPTKDDLLRIQKGYADIQYLLDNFEAETTVCRENGGGKCKRDADAVRKALGLRSTTDNLFQIEKVFAKVKNMDLDPDKLEQFFEASEDWNSAMNMSNSMAFISQFGEYNPGGGEDEVLKYLNEAKKQVVIAKDALGKIMDSLDIPKS